MKHRESKTQIVCLKWFRLQYPHLKLNLFSIPNGAALQGAPTERAKQWNRLAQEGATPGAADLFLAVGNGQSHGLFIEMKSPTGKLSDTQIAFRQSVMQQGYSYVVCYSLFEFINLITNYFAYK